MTSENKAAFVLEESQASEESWFLAEETATETEEHQDTMVVQDLVSPGDQAGNSPVECPSESVSPVTEVADAEEPPAKVIKQYHVHNDKLYFHNIHHHETQNVTNHTVQKHGHVHIHVHHHHHYHAPRDPRFYEDLAERECASNGKRSAFASCAESAKTPLELKDSNAAKNRSS